MAALGVDGAHAENTFSLSLSIAGLSSGDSFSSMTLVRQDCDLDYFPSMIINKSMAPTMDGHQRRHTINPLGGEKTIGLLGTSMYFIYSFRVVCTAPLV
jgi:hypothetical protein